MSLSHLAFGPEDPAAWYDGQTPDEVLQFLIDFALYAGLEFILMDVIKGPDGLGVIDKHDNTPQLPADRILNQKFIEETERCFGKRFSIKGEEGSKILLTVGSTFVLVIDPMDGSGERRALYKEKGTGRLVPIHMLPPEGSTPIEPSQRSTCIGIACFENGVLTKSVVYAPYRRAIFVANLAWGAAYLNGRRLSIAGTKAASLPFGPSIPYNVSYWNGAPIDARFLLSVVGPRLDTYAAIYQGCQVAESALGEVVSAFSIFPGDTVHDAASAALIAHLTGCIVTDTKGNPVDWDNFNGIVYSVNQELHNAVIALLNAPRTPGLPPGCTVVYDGISAKELLALRDAARYGRERDLTVWEEELASCGKVGIRDEAGDLIAASLITWSRRHAIFHDNVVLPGWQCQGLGKFLIDERIKLCAARGIPYMYVDVESGPKGVTPLAEYYEKRFGFKPQKNVLLLNSREGL